MTQNNNTELSINNHHACLANRRSCPDYTSVIMKRIYRQTFHFTVSLVYGSDSEGNDTVRRFTSCSIEDSVSQVYSTELITYKTKVPLDCKIELNNTPEILTLVPTVLANHLMLCRIKVKVYNCCVHSDSKTERLRAAVRNIDGDWTDCKDLNDEDLAKKVREDRVDILVDLTGHTANNRLGVFAMKPSPIQVYSWNLAFYNTLISLGFRI